MAEKPTEGVLGVIALGGSILFFATSMAFIFILEGGIIVASFFSDEVRQQLLDSSRLANEQLSWGFCFPFIYGLAISGAMIYFALAFLRLLEKGRFYLRWVLILDFLVFVGYLIYYRIKGSVPDGGLNFSFYASVLEVLFIILLGHPAIEKACVKPGGLNEQKDGKPDPT